MRIKYPFLSLEFKVGEARNLFLTIIFLAHAKFSVLGSFNDSLIILYYYHYPYKYIQETAKNSSF